jgi:hypothetical protein
LGRVEPLVMQNILLSIQSARDAVKDAVERLEVAFNEVDRLEENGENSPVPYSEIERAFSAARALDRTLEKLSR